MVFLILNSHLSHINYSIMLQYKFNSTVILIMKKLFSPLIQRSVLGVAFFYFVTIVGVSTECYAQSVTVGIPKNHKTERPNIIILYSDDQGTLDTRAFGAKDLQTPYLDKLAADGIKFTQAYAHAVCPPSRAAILTGRAPQRSGVNNWTSNHPNEYEKTVMNLKEITLAEHLKQYGYKSGIIGKWHLGATDSHDPLAQGFDYFFGHRGGFIDNYTHEFLHSNPQRPPFHDLYRNKKEIELNGKYFPDLQIDEVYSFLEENRNDPFFLYVPFNLPHYPEQPDVSFIDQYKHLKWPRYLYAAMISTLDDRVGKILKKLDELTLTENTIIIFMADNGHSTEDYYNWDKSYGANGGGGYTGKWRGSKGSFLEGGIRVPTIMSFPKKIPRGETRDQIISNMDFFPTICELIEVPLPENKIDGKNILPIINSVNAVSPHEVMYWQWQESWAVRKGNWKLIYKGIDTTDKFSGHLIKDREMPIYYLAKLDDTKPEEINYAMKYPNIEKEL